MEPSPKVCSECHQHSLIEDTETGERVCRLCGLVVERPMKFDQNLPFDTTYALTSELALNKSLGGTLSHRGLLRVLAKSRNGTADLGIRARQIRVITETFEPPALARILRMAYELSRSFELEKDYIFNNCLGRNIRRSYWLVKELGLNINAKVVAETVFWLTLAQYGKNKLAQEAAEKLDVDVALLITLVKLYGVLALYRKQKTIYKDVKPKAFLAELLAKQWKT